jgi:hypothetical protein
MGAQRGRWIHESAFGLLAGLCAWFAARGALDALRPRGSDLSIYWRAGRAVLDGSDPNAVANWIYPPGAAVALAPFALLPLSWFAWGFQLASLAALLAAARALPSLARDAGLPGPRWLAWAPLALVLRCADSNLTNGQVNQLTLLALVLALRAWSARRERAAGAWVGAATALKLVPGVLALHFAARRAWRALAWSALAAAAGLVALPCLAFGPAVGCARLAAWWHGLVTPYARGGEALLAAREYVPGQSLTAALYRALAATPATSQGPAGPTAELVALDPQLVSWIVLAAQLALSVLLLATLVRSRREERAGARLREASLCIAFALLAAPLVHKAHFVWLLVPYAALLAGAPAELPRAWRRARWTLVALSALLVGATTPFLLGRLLATGALTRNSVGLGALLVFLALCADVWAGRARQPLARAR